MEPLLHTAAGLWDQIWIYSSFLALRVLIDIA